MYSFNTCTQTDPQINLNIMELLTADSLFYMIWYSSVVTDASV